jgi:hypothetical protein
LRLNRFDGAKLPYVSHPLNAISQSLTYTDGPHRPSTQHAPHSGLDWCQREFLHSSCSILSLTNRHPVRRYKPVNDLSFRNSTSSSGQELHPDCHSATIHSQPVLSVLLSSVSLLSVSACYKQAWLGRSIQAGRERD